MTNEPGGGEPRRGVLLVNLGSPKSPEEADVRRYLREFLSDPLVLDAPAPIRWMVLNLFILPRRPKRSAEAYRKIWTDEGSPLVVTSEKVAAQLHERLDEDVFLAMRYGEPSIAGALRAMSERGIEDLRLIPLYPHFAMSSYETVVRKVQQEAVALGDPFRITIQPPFYDEPRYIDALRQSVAPHLGEPFDRILFSFHGVPERHIEKRDPTGCHCRLDDICCLTDHPATGLCYRAHCLRTTRALVDTLGLEDSQWRFSFQSRLGRDPWLKPFTDHVLEELPGKGVKRLLVICPSFVSDCLETLEEIGIEGKKTFLDAGGESFTLIPCLNEHPAWLDALEAYAKGRKGVEVA